MALASFSHLIIHASPFCMARRSTSEKAECIFVSATGRYFDCLLAVFLDNLRAQTQLPLAGVSGKQRKKNEIRREEKERVG